MQQKREDSHHNSCLIHFSNNDITFRVLMFSIHFLDSMREKDFVKKIIGRLEIEANENMTCVLFDCLEFLSK